VVDRVEGRARIKMSFKGRERPVLRSETGPVRATQSPLGEKKLSHGDSISSLKTDISVLIEKSFGSDKTDGRRSTTESGVEGEHEDPSVGGATSEALNEVFQPDEKSSEVTDLTDQIQNISFKSPNQNVDDFFNQSSPVTRSQTRRQSDGVFEFARPEDPVGSPDAATLRRQSSAFEFRTGEPQFPLYENLTRDVARASLRRRNSSVKDLVHRLETEAGRGYGAVAPALPPASARLAALTSTAVRGISAVPAPPGRPLPDIRESRTAARPRILEPLRISEEKEKQSAQELGSSWVDASEFFKNVTQAEVPQCGRSSIVKMRNQMRGRVQDKVSKFSQPGATPARPSTARRLSARLGTAGVRPPLSLPATPGPAGPRRQTLTGIRTTAAAGGKRQVQPGSYAAPTIASHAKQREKSPLPTVSVPSRNTKKSPRPRVAPERKNSNSRDLARHQQVERSVSGGARTRKPRVRRNRSDAERDRATRKAERRYLTIGYPGEQSRSPLRERQNTLATTVQRSNSDQTPSRAVTKQGDMMTRARLREQENQDLTTTVARTHSLKSDSLMSPQVKASMLTPRPVKRAASERCTPKAATYIQLAGSNTPVITMAGHRRRNLELLQSVVTTATTPRRSPRFMDC